MTTLGGRRRGLSRPLLLAAASVPVLAAFVSLGVVWANGRLPYLQTQAEAPATAIQPLKPPAPAAPPALQQRLDQLAEAYGEPVGIAVSDVEAGWVASVNGEALFPQQSVSKTWVALTVLDAVDRGEIRLDDPVLMTKADYSVFSQPIVSNIDEDGYLTSPRDLLNRAIIQSDNAANDMLLKIVGGVDRVRYTLESKGLEGLRLGADERNLQAMIAGLTWSQDLSTAPAFNQARSRLAPEARDEALKRYLDDPADGAKPAATARALAALKKGELLSPESSEYLIDLMSRVVTGPRRLRGGLPPGWKIAHKTGTGQDWRGASVGINDIALITAPDGRTYSVAVFIQRTFKPTPSRLEFMQQVSRAVVDHWQETSSGGLAKSEAAAQAG